MARTNRLPPLESDTTKSVKGGAVSYRSHSHAQMQLAIEEEQRRLTQQASLPPRPEAAQETNKSPTRKKLQHLEDHSKSQKSLKSVEKQEIFEKPEEENQPGEQSKVTTDSLDKKFDEVLD